jgi:uncharacterized protein YbjT (DUF2867 family)
MGKTAIILGATGLTGGLVLDKLLSDERYSTIKVFSRKSINIVHPKIMEYLGDLFELEKFKKDFTGDEVFCCIGTTTKKTPDKSIYRKIDHGIPVSAAVLSRENGIDTFLVMSSIGADPKSSVFYSRTKGEMERDVNKENITYTYVLRPSFIIGNRDEKRFGESIGVGVIKLLRFFLVGKLRKYRGIEAEKIADTMIRLANEKPDFNVIESDKIQEISSI